MQATFRFTFGPWNIHEGADPFGPSVRDTLSFAQKLKQFKPLGFDGVQFHDDDAVPDMNDLDSAAITQKARALKNMLDG
ncbi:MAG: xylose isomerase, partial [Lentisphaerae bacterium]|nr:xylose isomerase [Lentisphaerota bacterium]